MEEEEEEEKPCLPVDWSAADAEDKIAQQLSPARRMIDFGMKLNAEKAAFAALDHRHALVADAKNERCQNREKIQKNAKEPGRGKKIRR